MRLSNMKKPVIAFDFVRPPGERLADVDRGEAPKESMLGFWQLREEGYSVYYADKRHSWFYKLSGYLPTMFELPGLAMLTLWIKADILVIATRFSVSLALVGRLLGKKVVFYDSMQHLPQNPLNRLLVKSCLKLADLTIGFSDFQSHLWTKSFGLRQNKIVSIPYGVDCDFYKKIAYNKNQSKPYVIAVGRDPNRDFATLLEVIERVGWDLKLVTMPYLVPDSISKCHNVEVIDGLSYDELFRLYSGAEAAIVPLRKGTTHMSGVRAAMEAMLLEVPVVAAKSSGLAELFIDEDHIIYYEAEDEASLEKSLTNLSEDEALRESVIHRAKCSIVEGHGLNTLTKSLYESLSGLLEGRKKHGIT